MNSPWSKIRFFVVIGYLLMIVIMMLGLFRIHQNLKDFANAKVEYSDISELFHVSSIVTKLYDVESQCSFLSTDNAELYVDKFETEMPLVIASLDSLRAISTDTLRLHKLDTIQMLMEKKYQNLREAIVIMRSIDTKPQVIQDTMTYTINRNLHKNISEYLNSNIKQVEEVDSIPSDTTVVKGEPRGLRQRFLDLFTGGKPDSTLFVKSQRTIKVQDVSPLAIDTIIQMVRLNERMEYESLHNAQMALMKHQRKMLDNNSKLTMQIDLLLSQIEHEELQRSMDLLQRRDNTLLSSRKTVLYVIILAIGIALFFGILYLYDDLRSRRHRRQLEESNERINSLLSSREKVMLTLTHDIKAPTSSILGYIELMGSEEKDKKHIAYLKNMRTSSEHILQLISNLLDFHRMEANTLSIRAFNVNLCDVVVNTLVSFEPLAEQKHLAYQYVNNIPKMQRAFVDPYVIRQILANLISNAIKYTFEGVVRVEVDLLHLDNGMQLLISVADSGVGIAPEHKETIYNEFMRIDSMDVKSVGDGAGLGLAITYKFVTRLGGTIDFDSKEGIGTTFTVNLPVLPQQEESVDEFEELMTNLSVNIEGPSVLVVDDDPFQLSLTTEMLRRRGVTVHRILDSHRVIAAINKCQFDMILVDIQMPGINGYELVRLIRQQSGYEQTPIIAVSARSGMKLLDLRKSDFTDFLTKPLNKIELYDMVAKYLGNSALTTPNEENVADNQIVITESGVERLIEFVRDDAAVSIDILEAFINDTSANITSFQKAIKSHEWGDIQKIAHKMLPIVQMMNDKELSQHLQTLNSHNQLDDDVLEAVCQQMKQKVEEAKLLCQSLQKEINV